MGSGVKIERFGLRKAIFLDRDGIINHSLIENGKPIAPHSMSDFSLMDGVEHLIEKLSGLGYLIFIVTNQPDVARGKLRKSEIKKMHEFMCEKIKIDDVMVCYCEEGIDCPCYKPSPYMIIELAKKWNVDLGNSFMIGDRWRDVGAGLGAGCTTIFVDYAYDEALIFTPNHVVKSLSEACNIIEADQRNVANPNRETQPKKELD